MKKGKHPTSNIQHPTPSDGATGLWEFNDGQQQNRKFNLEERLLEFASAVIDLSENLPNTRAGNHIAGQVLRSARRRIRIMAKRKMRNRVMILSTNSSFASKNCAKPDAGRG